MFFIFLVESAFFFMNVGDFFGFTDSACECWIICGIHASDWIILCSGADLLELRHESITSFVCSLLKVRRNCRESKIWGFLNSLRNWVGSSIFGFFCDTDNREDEEKCMLYIGACAVVNCDLS
jgi:hypothetical protein